MTDDLRAEAARVLKGKKLRVVSERPSPPVSVDALFPAGPPPDEFDRAMEEFNRDLADHGLRADEPIAKVVRATESLAHALRDRMEAHTAKMDAVLAEIRQALQVAPKAAHANARADLAGTLKEVAVQVVPALDRHLWARLRRFDRIVIVSAAGVLFLAMLGSALAGYAVRNREVNAVTSSLETAAHIYGNNAAEQWLVLMAANDPIVALANGRKDRDGHGPYVIVPLRLEPSKVQ